MRLHTRVLGTGILLAGVFWLMTMSGCSVLGQNNQKSADQPPAPKEEESTTYYVDFGDVLIPGEMSVEKEGTVIFQTPGMTAGVLVLKGRVEPRSLIAFFQTNMQKDNWRLVGSFKSTVPRSMLLYRKENRWCVINISEKGFNTYVEIWVAPTIGEETTSGLLK